MKNLIEALAQAITKANKGMPAHCIRFTSGEHKGRYLHYDFARTVKTKRAAMTLVRHADHAKWLESCKYQLNYLNNPTFEVLKT